ncbi:hypothetical protein CDD81_3380 [Ophiocordyceps australis]|uniref:UspA domain-containing protein n=1 Tax=Ophiocordyceps australis TaxID=1399860 RepID=A0A2C5XW47_9HYPO|nr:hypothetical protein CDD81_3380 [Ophiocordyceps australis]
MSGDSRPMSIDAMLDMERQEVLALLENNGQTGASADGLRSSSPFAAPRSPVRSLLDIEEEGPSNTRTAPVVQAPVRSMLDIDGPVSATHPPVRSMLNLDSPPSPTPLSLHRTTSPVSPGFRPSDLYGSHNTRSMSDAGLKPIEFGPRAGSRKDRTSEYQFSGILPHSSGVPKRAPPPSKILHSTASYSDELRSPGLTSLQLPGDRGRRAAPGGRLGAQSKSPHNRWEARSRSPATLSPRLPPNKAMLGDGRILDINSAYRRLSDANLAFSSGSLAQLPMRKRSEENGQGRLFKDYLGPDGEHLDSSEEEDQYTSDDEDRGRKMVPRNLDAHGQHKATKSRSRSRSGHEERQSLSLLAAAEQERHQVASQREPQAAMQQPVYQYRSLIPDLEIKITNSSGDTVKPSKGAIHPNTSYDQSPSGAPSMVDSDDEADMDDIKRAQKLSFSMTNIISHPESHRSIRIIYRGEYNKIVQQAEEDHHRLRKYLVATDLSDESTHALEWAIGTLLRDGDTLIAIYCVDEETGIAMGDSGGGAVPDDPKAMREQAAVINTMANSRSAPAPANAINALTEAKRASELKRPSALHLRSESGGTPGTSPAPHNGRGDRAGRAEEERNRAIQSMTERILRLLRKTRLQVRVIAEVLQCKNPRHLITEVIDLVDPTLVVIGSRGRSALKGVILGSFSNYLVTKSSVPVMVARKRLRKHTNFKRTPVPQVNNLNNPAARSLANAKVD